jgi:WD40 repeat protein
MISRSLFPIHHLSWSPDGRHIAICGWGGAKTIRILSATTLATERIYRGHSPHVRGLAWSPDSQHMISIDLQSVHIWNTTTGELVSAYARDDLSFFSPGWSHDGRHVAAIVWREAAYVWRTSLGRGTRAYPGDFHSLAWSPTENRIALAGWGQIEIWSPLEDRLEFTLPCKDTGSVLALGWSPDGARIASSGSRHCAIEIWDAMSGELLNFHQSSKGDRVAVEAVAWSPDGLRIATCGIDSGAKIWNAETGALIGIYPRHSGGVYGIAWSPDGTHIASGDGDGNVHIWTPETDLV